MPTAFRIIGVAAIAQVATSGLCRLSVSMMPFDGRVRAGVGRLREVGLEVQPVAGLAATNLAQRQFVPAPPQPLELCRCDLGFGRWALPARRMFSRLPARISTVPATVNRSRRSA